MSIKEYHRNKRFETGKRGVTLSCDMEGWLQGLQPQGPGRRGSAHRPTAAGHVLSRGIEINFSIFCHNERRDVRGFNLYFPTSGLSVAWLTSGLGWSVRTKARGPWTLLMDCILMLVNAICNTRNWYSFCQLVFFSDWEPAGQWYWVQTKWRQALQEETGNRGAPVLHPK